jgi:2-methylisocitrate lyase-like PEP mutase family enzyme
MVSQAEKAATFRALHERAGTFVIPNPWDLGSARLLEGLGFEALATTSAGFANTLGRHDGRTTLEQHLAHYRALADATRVPINADFENAFADDPRAAAANIVRAAATGIAGCSIEDFSRDPARPIYDFAHAVERVQAAVEAVRSLGFPFVLTARAENLLHGRRDLDDTIRRLQAFEAAGADVLYAPGLSTLEDVARVASAVGRPINVLATLVPGATVGELASAGAKRLSVGSSLALAATGAALRAGREMLENGSFEWAKGAARFRDLRAFD